MRPILFFLSVMVCGTALSQPAAPQVDISKALAGKMGCGIVTAKPLPAASGIQVRNDTGTAVRLRCEAAIAVSGGVIYVLDGKIIPTANDLDPDDVEDVTVLQGPEAFAKYGEQAKGGAILITTKKQPLSRIVAALGKGEGLWVTPSFPSVSPAAPCRTVLGNTNIKQVNPYPAGDNNPLCIVDGEPFEITADTNARFIDPATIDSIWVLNEPAGAALYGSCGSRGVIILTTKLKTRIIDTVVVTGTYCWKRRNACHCCRLFVECRTQTTTARTGAMPAANTQALPKAYPNPVQRGNIINITLPAPLPANAVVLLSDASGKIVGRAVINGNSQKNTVAVPVDKTWSAGIYYARVPGDKQQTTTIPFLVQ
jgi:hypothetical protein